MSIELMIDLDLIKNCFNNFPNFKLLMMINNYLDKLKTIYEIYYSVIEKSLQIDTINSNRNDIDCIILMIYDFLNKISMQIDEKIENQIVFLLIFLFFEIHFHSSVIVLCILLFMFFFFFIFVIPYSH